VLRQSPPSSIKNKKKKKKKKGNDEEKEKSHCDCALLNYNFGINRDCCIQCSHPPTTHFCRFNKDILNPITYHGTIGEGKRAYKKLSNDIFAKTLLRRTKESEKEQLFLPQRLVSIRRDSLSEEEDEIYRNIYSDSTQQMGDLEEEGVVLNNIAHVFDLLTKLRQAVNHPLLLLLSPSYNKNNTKVASHENQSDTTQQQDEVCSSCNVVLDNDPSSGNRKIEHSLSHILYCKTCFEMEFGNEEENEVSTPPHLTNGYEEEEEETITSITHSFSTPPTIPMTSSNELSMTTLTHQQFRNKNKKIIKDLQNGVVASLSGGEKCPHFISTKIWALLEEIHKMRSTDKVF